MPCGDAPGSGLLLGEREAGRGLLVGERAQRGHGVDAAGGEEHNLGAMTRGLLQAVVGAEQVGAHEEAGVATHPGHHGGLRGALHERVERPGGAQVRGLAHVAVHEAHPALVQAGQVEL